MKNKGITLLALIVTVIIMLILAGVSINLITSGGIIDKTRETVNLYNEAAEREEFELAKIAAIDYMRGKVDKNILEENLSEGWKLEEETEKKLKYLSPNENQYEIEIFMETIREECLSRIKDKNGNEYTYYRVDKVTEEEKKECENQGIPKLYCDANLDGKLNQDDIDLISLISAGLQEEEINEYQKMILNVDGDKRQIINSSDLSRIRVLDVFGGRENYRIFTIFLETKISTLKIIEDEQTGKLYFIEEKVTEEEAETLEKYGVNRTMLGDMNLDGKLTQEDKDLLDNLLGGIGENPTALDEMLADVNQDGEVSTADTLLLGRKIVGLTN